MKTVRRLIFRTIAQNVLFVALAFSALAFFIDFVDELQILGRNGYKVPHALWTCLLLQGSHLYDLFPIALLIGGILAMSRMAQTSEFTILRTGGLGPGRALGLLTSLGLLAALVVVAIGNWYMPWSEQQLTLHRAQFGRQAGLDLGRGGTWLRERREVAPGVTHLITVNVGRANNEGHFGAVRIFEFDTNGHLIRRLSAEEAHVRSQGRRGSMWQLQGVRDTRWGDHGLVGESAVLAGQQLVDERQVPQLEWASSLTTKVVAASVLPPETMSTVDLWRYTQHLANNAQAAQRYELAFWNKVLYPFVCFVMMALALPFAYLHARAGSMSLKIFGGIMLGISFVLANHITSHLGLLHRWEPWLAAAAPSVVYLLLSMGAFVWLVRNQ
ncbi:MAG: export transporter permease LptG [Pseudomonadota bacterium]|jgi:lipopolysaccharide export system permease protein